MSGYSRFELAEDIADALGGGSLYPGMPTEARIVTGKRAPLDCFIRPITQTTNRVFRETQANRKSAWSRALSWTPSSLISTWAKSRRVSAPSWLALAVTPA